MISRLLFIDEKIYDNMSRYADWQAGDENDIYGVKKQVDFVLGLLSLRAALSMFEILPIIYQELIHCKQVYSTTLQNIIPTSLCYELHIDFHPRCTHPSECHQMTMFLRRWRIPGPRSRCPGLSMVYCGRERVMAARPTRLHSMRSISYPKVYGGTRD